MQYTAEDDLHDVDLSLALDLPEDQWIVPPGTAQFGDFLDWWQHLRDTDDALHELQLSRTQVDTLLEQRERIEHERGRMREGSALAWGVVEAPQAKEIKAACKVALKQGLPFEMVANLLEMTVDEMILAIHPTVTDKIDDYREGLLECREGTHGSIEMIAKARGLDGSTLRVMCTNFGVEYPTSHKRASGVYVQMAVDKHLEGMSMRKAIEWVQAHHPGKAQSLSIAAVSRAAKRRREQAAA